MKPVIVRHVDRPKREVVERLAQMGVATVHEAQQRTGLMRHTMRPIYRSARTGGTAITVLCAPGDNLMIHAAIELCRDGDVLVVATMSPSTDGMFGELLATSARTHGARGLVIDAGVRDVTDLAALDFPVWSAAISAQGTVKATPGCVNVPVVCAGTLVRPGDVIVGDLDGVVVVPGERAEEIALAAEQRQQREMQTRERLRRGELGLDLYGLREKLRALGVSYVDRLD